MKVITRMTMKVITIIIIIIIIIIITGFEPSSIEEPAGLPSSS